MHLERIQHNYKLLRFIFSLALLISFTFFAGTSGLKSSTQVVAVFILFVYTAVSFVTLFIKKVSIIDTILDVTFISAFIFTDFDKLKYFSLLYLFPLFFSGFTFESRQAYSVLILAIFEYSFLFFMYSEQHSSGYLHLILNIFAFWIITFAGLRLRKDLQIQQAYITKLEEEKKQAEVYKKLYRISAELAHEIRNPLASIKAAADLLAEGKTDKKLIDMIKNEAERLNKLLSDFLLLSRPKESEKSLISVKESVLRFKELFKDHKEINVNISGNPYVYMSEKAFYSVLSNLIKNAVEWAKNKVVINVYELGDKVYIEIEDDGEGIKPEIRDKIFEPFFSTSKTGTGLGLAITNRIVIENKGNILVEDSSLGGAKFVLIFPAGRKNESFDSR
ncbi:HAMP domain-containing sensor histidine kinase [Persephonella sp. IF05-L8]|uniref:ATP-binding protein n=1 Tax=Persephonella sp. IF05-L8 TaxID=1158338 RepID=UPI0004953DBF